MYITHKFIHRGNHLFKKNMPNEITDFYIVTVVSQNKLLK